MSVHLCRKTSCCIFDVCFSCGYLMFGIGLSFTRAFRHRLTSSSFTGVLFGCWTMTTVPSDPVHMDVEVPSQQYTLASSAFGTGAPPSMEAGSGGVTNFGTAPPGAAPTGPSDTMSWTADAAAAPAAAGNSMQVDPAVPTDSTGQPLLVPVAAGAPLVHGVRNAKDGPTQKLTVDLIKTYRHINYVRPTGFAVFPSPLTIV